MSVWDRVAGQEKALSLLKSASEDPRSSYLLVGPPGTGKVRAARAFSAAVFCHESACGTCNDCSRALRGVHPDVVWFQPEGTTHRVESIREAVMSAALSPMEAKRRVIIVEEADRILERSQNALLKALEEPGPSMTWILVAESLEPFLPTVVSRCQVIEFASVPEKTVVALIQHEVGLDEKEAMSIVRAARGDVGRALALAEHEGERAVRELAISAALKQEPTPTWALALAEDVQQRAKEVRGRLELEFEAETKALDEAGSGAGARKRVVDRQKRITRATENALYGSFLIWLGQTFRDLAAISDGVSPASVSSADAGDQLVTAATKHTTSFWIDMAESAIEGDLAITENANPPLVLESVLLGLARAG